MTTHHTKTLLVLFGPTGVGKTDFSIQLARYYGCPIVSSDSRQVYHELNIGVARPTPEQLAAVPHHLIACRSVQQDYTAGRYEADVIALLQQLFTRHNVVLLVGGSGLYIDAVCQGFDAVPAADTQLRAQLEEQLQQQGVVGLREQLRLLDPVFYSQIDLKNPNRLLRALEVCLLTGRPYSELRTKQPKARPFAIRYVGLTRERDQLYGRINLRVDQMLAQGLLHEVQAMWPYRHLNALKTVGYREFFASLEGQYSMDEAVELVKRNSRRYAKQQLSWFKRYPNTLWLDADTATLSAIVDSPPLPLLML